MGIELGILFLPFLACAILTGIHAYLGIHVLARKVIFIDIALAQIAALGGTVAFLLGYDPQSAAGYFLSLAFAVVAAGVFALSRVREERIPQEAVIGLAYAVAAAAAILLSDLAPHGAEHLKSLLAGSILWVTPAQVGKTALLYAGIGLVHYALRRSFLLLSFDPEEAWRRGMRVRAWDFFFFLTFAVVITSSVQMAGVLLVFCYLIAPAVVGAMFAERVGRRLAIGWGVGLVVSAAGLLVSYDRPTGPTIMVCFAAALLEAAAVRRALRSPRRLRAAFVPALGALAIGAGLFALASKPPDTEHAHGPPEHPLGTSFTDLVQQLKDEHANVRAHAADELGRLRDPRALDPLAAALLDPEPGVQECAARALGAIGDAAAVPELRSALEAHAEDEWVRLRLAQALAALGSPEGVPALLDLAERAEAKYARLEALRAAARLREPEPKAIGDDEGPSAHRLRESLRTWWDAEGPRLRYDPERKVFASPP